MWYVMQVWTGHEEEIVEQCRSKVIKAGESAFVMKGERKKQINGEWQLVEYLIFPSYVFIETDQIEDFNIRLRAIKEMTKVLRMGDDMIPIYPEEREYLLRLGGETHIAKYSEGYLVGEKLVIIDGALKGYEGKVKRLLRHKRLVIIELPLLGQMVEVKLGLGVVDRLRI